MILIFTAWGSILRRYFSKYSERDLHNYLRRLTMILVKFLFVVSNSLLNFCQKIKVFFYTCRKFFLSICVDRPTNGRYNNKSKCKSDKNLGWIFLLFSKILFRGKQKSVQIRMNFLDFATFSARLFKELAYILF